MSGLPADQDPFDLGFNADDEFSTPPSPDPWAEADAAGMGAPGAAGSRDDDPFADFPPARPSGAPGEADPFASMSAASSHNPVADLIAGAEAALGEVSVPRISIHAFCARPETAEIIEKASADRRMSRASTSVKAGGLSAAVEYYQNQPTPSLVVVETLDTGPELIAGLESLAEVCDPGTKVMVVGAANDIALYRELMRRGVSEYLVPPLNALQIIRSITTLYADPSAPFLGRQIAFVGAKGGSGASTIAHNFAWSLSERMQTGTVIVDFDLPFGTAGLNFNHDPLQGVADALGQPDRLDPVLMERMMVRCSDRLSLFAAPANLDNDWDIHADAFEEVAQKIRAAAPFVVMDLPHSWTAWKRKILLSSDDVVIVATPDLASLRNAKNMVDLIRQTRPNDAPPRLVINQVGVPGRPEIPVKDFGEALGLDPSLVIPFEPKTFGQAANNGQMLAEVGGKSKVAEGIDGLAQMISRREAPTIQKTSMLSSLFRKK